MLYCSTSQRPHVQRATRGHSGHPEEPREMESERAGGNKGGLLATMAHAQPSTCFSPLCLGCTPVGSFLPVSVAKTLVQATITVCPDSCSSLLPVSPREPLTPCPSSHSNPNASQPMWFPTQKTIPYTQMCVVIAKNWKQPKCASVGEWVNTLGCIAPH